MFDVKKLLIDVFDPQPGEVVTFAVDLPRDDVPDHEGWSARRAMADRWRRPLLQATESLLLVCPQRTADGEDRYPHPLWDELVGKHGDEKLLTVEIEPDVQDAGDSGEHQHRHSDAAFDERPGKRTRCRPGGAPPGRAGR